MSRGIARIVPSGQITAAYLVLYLRSEATSAYWEVAKQGTTFNEVSIETVRGLPVVVPPTDVQGEVVDEVASYCDPIDNALVRAKHEIELLREYRTRLVADVVTGKLDVREAAAALPDELETDEADAEELLDGDEAISDIELDAKPEEVEA